MPTSPPETRASLIHRLQDADDVAAWKEFADIYAPVIFRAARRQGLQAADADDLVQEVLSAVALSVTKWLQRDDRGTFRAWLFRIIRNTAIDFLTRRKHRAWTEGGNTAADMLADVKADSELSSQFDMEYRREIFLRASDMVRRQVTETTWQAFHRTSVLQQPVAEVALLLEMSQGSVYIARSRVMKRLQQLVKTFKELSNDNDQV